uniref:Pentapeptide repeat-containing protein n=1 Tax=Pinguiococcus pyrenoidosus TaxID=172671 RepID=A0A7R9YFH6_9STRA|mmetsp:Transcript_9374/g.35101  ORF Transcript_9374/g.35101 Transcript_9374/m.35101 type:complete len:366 (+) Transcript_9374:149-1246(+)|eukprot:scaffold1527_cov143-Pinguiococcus_pyrenoidosus.AAC.8
MDSPGGDHREAPAVSDIPIATPLVVNQQEKASDADLKESKLVSELETVRREMDTLQTSMVNMLGEELAEQLIRDISSCPRSDAMRPLLQQQFADLVLDEERLLRDIALERKKQDLATMTLTELKLEVDERFEQGGQRVAALEERMDAVERHVVRQDGDVGVAPQVDALSRAFLQFRVENRILLEVRHVQGAKHVCSHQVLSALKRMTAGQLALIDFESYVFRKMPFSNANVSGYPQSTLPQFLFTSGDICGCKFDGASLQDWNFQSSKADEGTSFVNADLSNAKCASVQWEGVDLRGAILRQTDFTNANLNGVDFTGADLSGATLKGAMVEGVVLNQTNLTGAYLTEVKGKWRDVHEQEKHESSS